MEVEAVVDVGGGGRGRGCLVEEEEAFEGNRGNAKSSNGSTVRSSGCHVLRAELVQRQCEGQ